MTKFTSFLILFILSFKCLVAEGSSSTRNCELETIMNLMELSAVKQYELLKSYEDKIYVMKGAKLQESVEKLHSLVYANYLDMKKRKKHKVEKNVLCSVLSRIAWFAIIRGKEKVCENITSSAVLNEALKLNPKNAIANYQYAYYLMSISEKDNKENIKSFLEKAINLKDQFPEALLTSLMFYLRNEPENNEVITSYRNDFLDSLSYYSPELNYFDKGYPATRQHILIYADKPYIKRKVYNDNFDRFKLPKQ